ncbi:ribosome binding protein, putative [Babesia ovata]|uniref:Ribosome binding protein, putative n=1 Tax=Babesia ovata TaxID=189622 RepID=A0A2H6K7J1_9APIC|nr:ribosome binding protein, putative [Babesia ovata]GBE58960.1 ribosome binding protein, putative [Babesia ovata]
MEAHGVPLNTLKDCLQFLLWLHRDDGKQQQVAEVLFRRIDTYYQKNANYLSIGNVKKALSPFLDQASHFYTRLCYKVDTVNYNGSRAEEIVKALLDCVPKFLAAIYYLWYCVDNTFRSLGGGTWELDWPGGERGGWLTRYWGGQLQDYLRAEPGADYGGIIPGGFGYGEVRYYTFWGGYPQGAQMAPDLRNLLDKEHHNFFRDVFVTSVIEDSGTHKENMANALELVRKFCEIVEQEREPTGGTLITKLNEGLNKQWGSRDKSICWKDLHSHCAKLEEQFNKLFAEKRFDFTGQSTGLENLKKEELAVEAAKWFRTNLILVRGNLQHIKVDAAASRDLGKYFTNHLFPYGFTFDGRKRFQITPSEAKKLPKELSDVISGLQKSSDGDLDRLKDILDGKERRQCPEDDSKKAEGAQNQGKKVEGNPTQDSSQSADTSSGTSVGDSPAPTPSPSDPGLPGPAGQPSDTVQGPTSVDTPGPQPTSPPVTVLTQPTSVPGSDSWPAGDQGAGTQGGGGQDVGPGSGHDSSSGATPSDATGPGGAGVGGGGLTEGTDGGGHLQLGRLYL